MPIRDSECLHCGNVEEHYYHNWEQPANHCEVCGGDGRFLYTSRFAVVWTGFLSKYNDKNLEGAQDDSFWVTEKKTPDGKPRQRLITNMQERKEFMKREGLIDSGPREASPDGKTSTREGQGMKGVWL